MNEKKYLSTLTYAISFFFSLPFPIVLLAICFGPSLNEGAAVDFLKRWALLLILIEFPLSYGAFLALFAQKNFLRFYLMLAAVASVMILSTIGAGILLHRDFFTATFQYLLCLPAVLLYYLWITTQAGIKKTTMRAASRSGYVLVFLYSEWIMLMGYAIATRAEPRPIEALIYNVYNLFLVLILFLSAQNIERRTRLSVQAGFTVLKVDNRDITSVLGQKKTSLFHAFAASPERTLRCAEIQVFLKNEKKEETESCASCTSGETKATLCMKYRNTYNTILDLKKLLEFLEIGTITTSLNKRNILNDGWKLVLFENVKLTAGK